MRRNSLLAIFFFLVGNIGCPFAQNNPRFTLQEQDHDFGIISDQQPVSYNFYFTNTGSDHLTITNIIGSCNCLNVFWEEDLIKPGERDTLTIQLDPTGRSGLIDESVRIFTNDSVGSHLVQITAQVKIKLDPKLGFDYEFDGIRMRTAQINFSYVFKGDTATKTVELYNSTLQPTAISFTNVPRYVSIEKQPITIGPQQFTEVVFAMNSNYVDQWDYVIDKITLLVNGTPVTRKLLTLAANVREDFSNLSETEKELAPVSVIQDPNFNFGTIPSGKTVTHKFKLKNNGKTDLIIRELITCCGCTAAKPDNVVIKPDKSIKIEASLDSKGIDGDVKKSITLITNDPENYKQFMYFSGNVIPAR
jgi:hypothetical protein